MGRKKKELPNLISNPHVIIYDDKNIQYITGLMAGVDYEPQVMTYEHIDGSRTSLPLNTQISMCVNDTEILDNITLDDTLMKRIAKFNKEQECKRLDEEIKEKKEKIKELDDILKDRDKRVDKLKKYVAEIYDMDIKDDDDYDWDE